MRFEVNVDDGSNLDALHAARKKHNADHAQDAGFVPANDMSSFVQRLMDQAVASSLQPLPMTLPAALTRIAELEQQLASAKTAAPAAPA